MEGKREEWRSPRLISILERQRCRLVWGEDKMRNGAFFVNDSKVRGRSLEGRGMLLFFKRGRKKEKGGQGTSVVNYSRRRDWRGGEGK